MPRKKWSKSKKRNVQAAVEKGVRILFAILIVYMAGYTILTSTRSLEEETEEVEEHTSFIELVVPVAQKMQEIYGVRASISIAQAILESNWGMSELALNYNNLYGVKGDPEESVLMETQEFVDNEWITIQDYFKVYENFAASIEDHAQLMVEGTSWNPTLYHPVLNAPTYQEAAKALQQAGYATDPTYPQKVIDIVEQYELYKYDLPVQQQ